jgi:hypothetical protein
MRKADNLTAICEPIVYEDSFTFLYVVDVPICQETHLRASTTCYEDNFTFLCVSDVPTSQ